MEMIGSIYNQFGDQFGIALTDAARAAMIAFLADNRPGKHGTHRYDADAFGLSKAAVHARFGPYIEAYGVTLAC